MYTDRLTWETLRTLDSASMVSSSAYYKLGTPLSHPSYICKLVNNSNVLLTISIDGVTDVDVSPEGSFWLYDEGKVGISGGYPLLPKGTQIYCKSATAGVGLVYLVTQYIIPN